MRQLVAIAFVLLVACSRSSSDRQNDPPDDGSPPPVEGASPVQPTFTFESGPVRPLALAQDRKALYAANTANGSLDVLAVTNAGLTLSQTVFVGIDPVAVAERVPGEVWVVNHLSDSVSVVDVSASPIRVVRTLLVGDEPSDIVFAGGRAFITTAHRGQHRSDPSLAGVPGAGDPELTTPGVGRADVWVFDPAALGDSVGGTPTAIVSLFGDSPRALAVSPNGETVYAAVFKSGNQTTTISSEVPCAGFDATGSSTTCVLEGVNVPGAPPGPATNYAGINAPAVAVNVKTDANGAWRDVLGRDWSAAVRFDLPDQDVFAISTSTLATTATYRHVGTTLFAMAVNPVSGRLYVSNTEARNDLRFEGPGTFAGETLQGHLAESRITVIANGAVSPRHLNKHIDYDQRPAPPGTAAHSLATPLNVVVSADGATLYVSAFGSSRIGVLPTASLEDDTFNPTIESERYITVTGGGPSGLVLDEPRGRLYVATRFDDGISVVDLAQARELSHLTLTNPEPSAITAGRRFLYDATISSSNGEAACASCHMFGDKDQLAWDLGNPDGDVTDTPVVIKLGVGAGSAINGTGDASGLHPMKGPLTTQTLRGLQNHGALHWRGDRISGFFGTDPALAPPYDSELGFDNFIVAFEGLLGLPTQFPVDQMHAFTTFAMGIMMPPNPVRALDNQLNATQAAGRSFFLGCDGVTSIAGAAPCDPRAVSAGHFSDGVPVSGFGFTCQGCHTLDPERGYFGGDGTSSFENLPQITKIPQLRNLYDKVGMFGVVAARGVNPGDNGPKGPQIRGSGYALDGGTDTIFRFLQQVVFNAGLNGRVGFTGGDQQRRAVEQYMLAFDNDLAPAVGQQVTLRSDNAAAVGPRISLLIARGRAAFTSKQLGGAVTECDLIARVVVGGQTITYVMDSDGTFHPNAPGAVLDDAALRALAATPGQEVTYTCMPPDWVRGT